MLPRELAQEAVERGLLALVEAGEEVVLELDGEGAQLREGALAVGRHPDGLPTAVRRVALALDQPAVLQLVEEADELAAIVAVWSYASSACSLAAKPRRLSRNVVEEASSAGSRGVEAAGEVSVVTGIA
jgi:hypothetical protein